MICGVAGSLRRWVAGSLGRWVAGSLAVALFLGGLTISPAAALADAKAREDLHRLLEAANEHTIAHRILVETGRHLLPRLYEQPAHYLAELRAMGPIPAETPARAAQAVVVLLIEISERSTPLPLDIEPLGSYEEKPLPPTDLSPPLGIVNGPVVSDIVHVIDLILAGYVIYRCLVPRERELNAIRFSDNMDARVQLSFEVSVSGCTSTRATFDGYVSTDANEGVAGDVVQEATAWVDFKLFGVTGISMEGGRGGGGVGGSVGSDTWRDPVPCTTPDRTEWNTWFCYDAFTAFEGQSDGIYRVAATACHQIVRQQTLGSTMCTGDTSYVF